MFWVRYEHNEALGRKKQQVDQPHLENGAPKVSTYKFQLLIVPRFGFCEYFESEDHLQSTLI